MITTHIVRINSLFIQVLEVKAVPGLFQITVQATMPRPVFLNLTARSIRTLFYVKYVELKRTRKIATASDVRP